jgi:hypothetical protein
MEEAVWVAIGAITLVIGVGIFITLFAHYQAGVRSDRVPVAVAQLQAECNLVCKAPKETLLATEVVLPAGTLLTTQQDKVCAAYEGTVSCQRCDCPLAEETVLNLTGEETLRLYKEHRFTCAVHHGDLINITCEG